MARRMTLLHLQAIDDEAVWRTALASHNVPSVCVPGGDTGLVERLRADPRLAGAGALVVDAPALAREASSIARATRRLLSVSPELAIFVRLPAKAHVEAPLQSWAKQVGMAGFLPGTSAAHWRESIVPSLTAVVEVVGRADVLPGRVGEFLRVLDVTQTNADANAVGTAHDAAARASAEGIDLAALSADAAGPDGLDVRDRTFRGKAYRACLVASEAVDWIVERERVPRAAAVAAGLALQAFGRCHHVVRERAFADDFLFFRLAPESEVAPVNLAQVAAEMAGRRGVDIADRAYLGRTYEQCFVGSEAVDWLGRRHGLSVGSAEAVGQALIDAGLVAHVLGAHAFSDARLFYRFTEPARG